VSIPSPFAVKMRGMTFTPGYPGILHTLAAVVELGRPPVLALVRDPENAHDPNAIAVQSASTGRHLGHLPAPVAARIAPELDAGKVWTIETYQVLVAPGHEDNPGLSLTLRRAS
jgi:hypothetical protein